MLEGVKRLYAEQDRGTVERVRRHKSAGAVIPSVQSNRLKKNSKEPLEKI